MATTVDMSLDDIIKNRRNSERIRGRGRGRRGHGRGRGQGRSFGGGRMNGNGQRGYLGVNTRPSSYTIAKSIRRRRSFPWQTDLFEDSIRAAGIKGIEIGTKLYVSNLDYGVTNEDIRELFSEIGDMKRYAVHYDRTGRPSGSAEVVYTRRSDAFSALKRYNNVLLDGKPMKIEMVGSNSEVPVSARINVSGINGRKKRTVVVPGQRTTAWGSAFPNHGTSNNSHRGGLNNSRGRGRGRGSGGRGQGSTGRGRGSRGRGRGQPLEKSAEQLDKELESYHAGAMDTN